jgi:hypothetical protein
MRARDVKLGKWSDNLVLNPLTATDIYIRQIWLFPQRIQNISFIFIVMLRTWKSLTPKDATAVKGLTHISLRILADPWWKRKSAQPCGKIEWCVECSRKASTGLVITSGRLCSSTAEPITPAYVYSTLTWPALRLHHVSEDWQDNSTIRESGGYR